MSAHGAWAPAPALRWRAVLAPALVVIAAFVGLGLLSEAFTAGPQGPESSSYATSAGGVAAWAELAARAGHPVTRLRRSLASAGLDPTATVVVLDADALLPGEGRRLLSLVTAGGRVLIGGHDPRRILTALSVDPPAWRAGASVHDVAVASDPALAAVSSITSAGQGTWADARAGTPLVRAASGGALLSAQRRGRGTLYLIADPSPLQNRLLARADNAQLALGLSGTTGRPLVFVESVHGYGESRGLAALPGRWKAALALLGLSGLVWVIARGRRLGPPERLPDEDPPARQAYAAALTLLLRRRPPAELEAPLRAALQRELTRRRSPAAGATAEARAAGAHELGLEAAEIQALAGETPDGEQRVLALGAALARLRGPR